MQLSRQKNDVIAWCDIDEGFVFRVWVKGEVAFGKLVVACGEAGLRQGEAEAFARAERKLDVGVGGVGFDPAVLNGARGGVLDEYEEAVPFEFMTAIGERGQIQGVEGIEGTYDGCGKAGTLDGQVSKAADEHGATPNRRHLTRA